MESLVGHLNSTMCKYLDQSIFSGRLTDGMKKTVFSPRFNSQGTKLVFLEGVPSGHHISLKLMMVSSVTLIANL